ncbi:MAG: serine/threonine protein kinase [Cyanobacteria bacterium J06554_3]
MLIKNQYQVLKTLGEGGFGTAYLAKDTHMPSERQCVVKELKPISDNQDVYTLIQERFQREAAILEQLGENHPQIPRLYSYFSEDQKFYLVQEWIEGTTLEMLASQPKAPNESMVRSLLTSLLHVLDYVHSKGIIHRDIKPENIILRQGTGEPVLIDFGAVRETMGTVTAGGKTMAPASSIVIGTPGYMSSEQATGRPVPASDLYSLALTAVYLLTGQTPQAMQAHPQTGELMWQDAAGAVSPELMAVLTKAVAYHPRDRYSSAKEMLTALSTLNASTQTGIAQPVSNQAATVLNTQPVAAGIPAQSTTPNRQIESGQTQVVNATSSEKKGNSLLVPIGLSAMALAAIALTSLWGIRDASRSKGGDNITQLEPASTEPSESVIDENKCFDLFAYDAEDTTVNVRESPNGEVIDSVPNLTRIQAKDLAFIESEWNEVLVSTNTKNIVSGYIWGDMLYRTVYQVQDTEDPTVNLRTAPNGNVLTAVTNGTEVGFLGVEGEWTQVQLGNGQVGYIATTRLVTPSCF